MPKSHSKTGAGRACPEIDPKSADRILAHARELQRNWTENRKGALDDLRKVGYDPPGGLRTLEDLRDFAYHLGESIGTVNKGEWTEADLYKRAMGMVKSELQKAATAHLAMVVETRGQPSVDAAQSSPNLGGYLPADTLAQEEGIVRQRLSEAVGKRNVKTEQAPPGMKDSQGRGIRTLYNRVDAIKHCSPRATKSKTYRNVGRNHS